MIHWNITFRRKVTKVISISLFKVQTRHISFKFILGKVIITKGKALDLLSFEISIVPGYKVCSRCSSELSEILNGKIEHNPPSIKTVSSPSELKMLPDFISTDIQSLQSILTQVCF